MDKIVEAKWIRTEMGSLLALDSVREFKAHSMMKDWSEVRAHIGYIPGEGDEEDYRVLVTFKGEGAKDKAEKRLDELILALNKWGQITLSLED